MKFMYNILLSRVLISMKLSSVRFVIAAFESDFSKDLKAKEYAWFRE